jgi:hypothetical protein
MKWLLKCKRLSLRSLVLFLVAAGLLSRYFWSIGTVFGKFPSQTCTVKPSREMAITKAFYINLNGSASRRSHMEEELSRFSFPIRRWEASAPTQTELKALSHEMLDPHKLKLPEFLKGMLGVRKTNIQLLKHLFRTGSRGDLFLVLEDDVLISPYLESMIPCVLQAVPKNWDTIRFDCVEGCQTTQGLGYPSMGQKVYRALHSTSRQERQQCHCDGSKGTIVECWFCGGAFATLYHHQSLQRVIDLWESFPITDHDCELTTDRLHNYCVNWDLVRFTNNFGTTVPKNV